MKLIGNYKIGSLIGQGSFGNVYSCKNKLTNNDYAMKIDKTAYDVKSIRYEASILKYLKKVPNVANLIHYGSIDNKQYMVLELYGLTLEEYIISNKSIRMIDKINYALQMLNIIKNVHSKGIIHRDIKPENFVFTIDMRELVLIDFGLSKLYLDGSKNHKRQNKTEKLIGCLHYASINSHDKIELSRRDDLISLFYSFIYMFFGKLPWNNISSKTISSKMEMIKYEKKMFIHNQDYDCNIMKKMKNTVNYLYELDYDEKPNYFLMEIHINNILENT